MSLFGNLFKKKDAPAPAPAAAPGGEALRAFAAGFEPESTTIIALSGPEGFSCAQQEDSGLLLVELPITHWVYDDDPDELCTPLQGQNPRLVILTDDRLLQVLRPRLMRNFILKVAVRPDAQEERFLLTDLPEPGFDPDLKAILERRMTPETFEAEGVGELTLNPSRGCFQADVDFADQSIVLSVDGETEEAASALLPAARILLGDQDHWAALALRLGSELALEEVCAWMAAHADDYPEEAPDAPDAAVLALHMDLEEIQISEGGRATFWYGDSGLLLGRSIRVAFTPAETGEALDAAARPED